MNRITINGKTITMPITYDENCSTCGGTGAKTSNDIKTCPDCGGRGYIRTQQRTIFGVMENQTTCPKCGGTGKLITDKCPDCGGKGYKRVKKDMDVNIPAGINSGQQLRVAGKGERGVNGGPNGDLFLEIISHKVIFFTEFNVFLPVFPPFLFYIFIYSPSNHLVITL